MKQLENARKAGKHCTDTTNKEIQRNIANQRYEDNMNYMRQGVEGLKQGTRRRFQQFGNEVEAARARSRNRSAMRQQRANELQSSRMEKARQDVMTNRGVM
jgi:hypothetical protein